MLGLCKIVMAVENGKLQEPRDEYTELQVT
jgi:hypothetical protein